jgi:hypothetical protein
MAPSKDLPSSLLPFRGPHFTAGNRTSGFGFNVRTATKGERIILFYQMHGLLDLVESLVKCVDLFGRYSGYPSAKVLRMQGKLMKGREVLVDYTENGKLRDQQQLAYTRHECMVSLIDAVQLYPGIVEEELVQAEVTKIRRSCPAGLRTFLQENNFI